MAGVVGAGEWRNANKLQSVTSPLDSGDWTSPVLTNGVDSKRPKEPSLIGARCLHAGAGPLTHLCVSSFGY